AHRAPPNRHLMFEHALAGLVDQVAGMARRRSPTRPAAPSATAMARRLTRGVADTGAPGTLGMCEKGERSSSHWLSCRAAPTRAEAEPRIEKTRWLPAHCSRPTAVARTGSARPAASSDRNLRVAWMA